MMNAVNGNMDDRTRVAYIDDQLLFREALVAVLEDSGLVSVVQSIGHEQTEGRSLRNTAPSVLLLALDAQTHDPMVTLQGLRQTNPQLPVCALVAVDRLDRAREAIATGCKGAVSTAASLNLLIAALQSVSSGQAYVDPLLGGRLLAKAGIRNLSRTNRIGADGDFQPDGGEISKN
ncbi:MAG: hypothetical protein DLM53_03170 [Candidatus Eremiobacter antarcticus]|nr:response regulator transcription factor [Candidatus Eremiobacteraeota bacterium]MBC5808415.1 response regulator transcription factor [Candidatus Eremiobacteraeota bacterium]PZR63774.1 MAG: hypothetical protein DLM53_03170 [Candidatus Eremiobacter sp. RRmetagenome_bin22]